MEELISVIVPVYNVELYLERCILSIIQQDYKKLEIILVDDGSKDSSGVICEKYAKQDNRIRVIHKPNGGLGPARNTALDLATGAYLFFVDSDDYIKEGIIKELYNACVCNHSDIACCGYQSGNKKYYCDGNLEILQTKEATSNMLMCKDIDANAVCKLYRRELFDGIRYPACAYEVVPVTYKVFLRARSVSNIKKCGYYIEKRPGSITRSSFGKNNLLYLTLSKEMKEDIKQNHIELEYAAEVFYLNALITMTEKSREDRMARKTNEYIQINKEFEKNFYVIMRHSKITKRKKIIAFLIHFNLYAMIKTLYDRMN